MISKATADLLLRLRDLDIEIWLDGERVQFDAEVPADLAAGIAEHHDEIAGFLRQTTADAADEDQDSIPEIPRDRPLPVSFAQRRLWVLHRLGENSAAYNMLLCTELRGALDVDVLRAGFADVVARHESLRTSFDVHDGEPVQVVHQPNGFELAIEDLSGEPDPRAAAVRRAEDNARVGFDIAAPPLFSAVLLKVGPQAHVLSVTLAHIIADGWSAGVLWNGSSTELLRGAQARRAGHHLARTRCRCSTPTTPRWQHGLVPRRTSQDGMLGYWTRAAATPCRHSTCRRDRPRPAGADLPRAGGGRFCGMRRPEELAPVKALASRARAARCSWRRSRCLQRAAGAVQRARTTSSVGTRRWRTEIDVPSSSR